MVNYLEYKDIFCINQDDFYLKELEQAYSQLENYCKVYECVMLLHSFTDEMKMLINNLHLIPQKDDFKSILTTVFKY